MSEFQIFQQRWKMICYNFLSYRIRVIPILQNKNKYWRAAYVNKLTVWNNISYKLCWISVESSSFFIIIFYKKISKNMCIFIRSNWDFICIISNYSREKNVDDNYVTASFLSIFFLNSWHSNTFFQLNSWSFSIILKI
jgi:hypothetical protein